MDCLITLSNMNPPICLMTVFTSHSGNMGMWLSISQYDLNINQVYDLQLISQMKNFRSITTSLSIFFLSGTILNFFIISQFYVMPYPQITIVPLQSILSMPIAQKYAYLSVKKGILNVKQHNFYIGLTSAISSPFVQNGTHIWKLFTWYIIMHKFYIFVESNPQYRSSTLVPVTFTANYDLLSILFIFQPVFGLFNIYIALSFFFPIYLKCLQVYYANSDTYLLEIFIFSTY